MSLAADVTAALPGLRAAAEALMVDTCTIAGDGAETFDPATGTYTAAAGATTYTGPCQVQVTDSATVGEQSVGEQLVSVERVVVKIPVAAPSVPIGSLVTVTAVDDSSDPALVGRVFRVTGSHAKTFATARRLPCELVTP